MPKNNSGSDGSCGSSGFQKRQETLGFEDGEKVECLSMGPSSLAPVGTARAAYEVKDMDDSMGTRNSLIQGVQR